MANADGSVIINTELDDKQAQAELNRLAKKIDALNAKVSDKTQAKMALTEQANQLGAALDTAKAKLDAMQSGGAAPDAIKEQAETVGSLQYQWDTVNSKIDRYTREIDKANFDIGTAKDRAGELSAQLAAAGYSAEKMNVATKKAAKSANNFASRIKAVVRSALVFTVITQALSKLRNWVGDIIKASPQASAAVAKLKGTLLTLVQPLVDVIIPAFTKLVELLTAVAVRVAGFISAMAGTTVDASAKAAEALNNETEALNGTSKSAKKASRSLAAFDEINKLSGTDNTKDNSIDPDFTGVGQISDNLKEIADAVLLIGAGFALWKISDSLPGQLGLVSSKIAGIAIAIGGLIALWNGLKDAWENGLDWGNLALLLAGLATIALGLCVAFGKLGAAIGLIVGGLALFATGIMDAWETGVNLQNLIGIIVGVAAAAAGLYIAFGSIAAGIALVVGGAAMVVTAFRDIMENGTNLYNVLLMIGGLIAAGLGISLLVGSWIPLAVAAIAGLVVGVLALEGNLDEFIGRIKQIFSGLIDFITGVFSLDFEKALNGIRNMVTGLLNADITLIESFINFFIDAINWIIEKLNGLSVDVPEWVPGIGGEKWGFNISPIQSLQIPRLATGAVIPPNREFLAVLGDQKQGTNIEAPAAAIEAAVARGMAQYGGGNQTAILKIGEQELGRIIFKLNKDQTQRVGIQVT